MNKEKFIFNLLIFSSALCLVISIFTKAIIPTLLALLLAIIAQHHYRKKYPRRFRSYKELLKEKYDRESQSRLE